MSKSIKKEYPFHIAWFNEQGVYHREDGPAIEWDDGDEDWWVNGKRHRLGGPALELVDDLSEWWINDHYVYIY